MNEKTWTVRGPLAGMLLVMLSLLDCMDWALRGFCRLVFRFCLQLLWACKQWLLRLHRWWMLYPLLAAIAICIAGPWAFREHTALVISVERGNVLAEEITKLQHEGEMRVYRARLAYQLAEQSAHTREFSSKDARENAFREFASNGGPLWMQAQLIEHVLGELERAEWPREAQLVYLAVLAVECGFNPFALNPKSSAAGPNQFVLATGQRYGLSATGQLEMGKNIQAGIQHFHDNWERLDRAGYLKDVGGVQWMEMAFPLFYQLHHDGQNSKLAKGPSEQARDGIVVGMAYLKRATPVMFSDAPEVQEPEDFRQLVAERTDEVVRDRYEQVEQHVGTRVDGLLKGTTVGEWLDTFSRWMS